MSTPEERLAERWRQQLAERRLEESTPPDEQRLRAEEGRLREINEARFYNGMPALTLAELEELESRQAIGLPMPDVRPRSRRAKSKRVKAATRVAVAEGRTVVFEHAGYLGGLSSYPKPLAATAALSVGESGVAVVLHGSVQVHIPSGEVASLEVVDYEAAKSKVGATLAFGVLGGLAARGSTTQTAVIVRTRTRGTGYFVIDRTDPFQVRAQLITVLQRNGIPFADDAVSTPAPSTLAPDIADEIRKLAALRDEGLLTAEEFLQAKAKLLA